MTTEIAHGFPIMIDARYVLASDNLRAPRPDRVVTEVRAEWATTNQGYRIVRMDGSVSPLIDEASEAYREFGRLTDEWDRQFFPHLRDVPFRQRDQVIRCAIRLAMAES